MTKTDLKNLGVDQLREVMQEHFDGITEDTTKEEMKDIIDSNWDEFLEEALNPVEDEPDEPGDDEPDEEEADSDKDLSKPDLSQDLYSGRPRS